MTIMLYDLAAADPEIRFSPYCWRTKMALVHKGLEFRTEPWRFTETATLAPSGQGRVPVIVDHGIWVADSWRIALHLDSKYPAHPPLMRDDAARAQARLIMSWADSLHGPISRLVLTDIHDIVAEAHQPYFRQSREQRFGMTLEAYTKDRSGALQALAAALFPAEQVFSEYRFLGGAAPDYADYALFGTLMWPHVVGREPVIETTSRVGQWFERMLDANGGLARSARTVRG